MQSSTSAAARRSRPSSADRIVAPESTTDTLVVGTAIESALAIAARSVDSWKARTLCGITHDLTPRPDVGESPASTQSWLAQVPDVGPACEMVIADQLFHDLHPDETAGLLGWIRGTQDESGAWLDVRGEPDLSLTVLGWWARAVGGDDPEQESMVRARRVVHALGGAQRANFIVRLWLAMAGQIPWSYLPAIPGELFLLPDPLWVSPSRFSPWARGILTPYYIIARAPARLHLPDATPLLLQRHAEALVAPRLTRPGLAGDLLQAFDRTVKLSRKLPRGALPRWALARTEALLGQAQQRHGGWFSTRPTLLSLVALRVVGASSNDPRIERGLAYLRHARGLARIPHGRATGEVALAQGLSGPPLPSTSRLLAARPAPNEIAWLLRQELTEAGPWQTRADASAGGWPAEPGAGHTLDLEATCAALECLGRVPSDSQHAAAAWAATRRATDVLLAMQEGAGGFARFERGESRVFMRRLPWTDADLLGFGAPHDNAHVTLTARALTQLGNLGFRLDDDRVARGVGWLERHVADEHEHRAVTTLASLGRCAASVCPSSHPLRAAIERRLRARQREDGSFGSLVETSLALRALLELGPPCVQVTRALRHVLDALPKGGIEAATTGGGGGGAAQDPGEPTHWGFGLSPACFDVTAGARETFFALGTARDKMAAPTPRGTRPPRQKRS